MRNGVGDWTKESSERGSTGTYLHRGAQQGKSHRDTEGKEKKRQQKNERMASWMIASALTHAAS